MHEVSNIILTKPFPKIEQNFIDFEKSQNFPKIPKVRSENDKCMIEWVKKIILDERRWSLGRKSLGNEV